MREKVDGVRAACRTAVRRRFQADSAAMRCCRSAWWRFHLDQLQAIAEDTMPRAWNVTGVFQTISGA